MAQECRSVQLLCYTVEILRSELGRRIRPPRLTAPAAMGYNDLPQRSGRACLSTAIAASLDGSSSTALGRCAILFQHESHSSSVQPVCTRRGTMHSRQIRIKPIFLSFIGAGVAMGI